jgi:hypothetical protein
MRVDGLFWRKAVGKERELMRGVVALIHSLFLKCTPDTAQNLVLSGEGSK